MIIRTLDNENGSIMVLVLMILALMTILGTSATTTTVTELQIVRNDVAYKKNFYTAEAAAIEAAQMVTDYTELDDLREAIPDWMNESDTYTSLTDDTNWGDSNSTTSSVSTTTSYSIIDKQLAKGASLDVSAPRDHELAVIGLCQTTNSGKVMIEIGVRKKF